MVNTYLAALEAGEAFAIGELHVSFAGDEATIAAPGAETGVAIPATEHALRARVRTDEHGRYRPLSGARTMPGGWYLRCSRREVEALVDVVYPLAITHARQMEAGTLRLIPLDDVLSRQSGRYGEVERLSPEARDLASLELCGRCVRTPAWRGDTVEGGAIPCPEPCSVLVALCREALFWEKHPVPAVTPDYTVPFADFEVEGNEVREAYLQRMAAPEET